MSESNEWKSIPVEQKQLILQYQKKLPVPVGALAKDLGIVVKGATLPAGISGEIKEVDGQCVVRVNRHDVKERQRFTVAHEIAHFLLHKDKIGDGIVDDILYRSSLSNTLEAEANRLAADIIMPWNLIEKAMKSYSGLKIEEKIENLARELEVSLTAVKIRLGRL